MSGGDHLLVDALAVPEYCQGLTQMVAGEATFRMADGDLNLVALPGLAELVPPAEHEPPPLLQRTERNNVSLVFGQRLLYKSFRRMEEGVNPDVELGRALAKRGSFTEFAPILGYAEFRSRKRKREPATLAVVHRYVPNQGHAWQYTLEQIASFYERVAALTPEQAASPLTPGGPSQLEASHELMGGYLDSARQMAQLTARMHRALAALGDAPAFAPEPITRLYQRSLYQSIRNLIAQLCSRIERDLNTFPTPTREAAERLTSRRRELSERIGPLLGGEMGGQRIRCQGDYHLGELLHIGTGFVVTDFEGDPGRSIGERRVKRSPLRDVASMVRSFDYAARCVLLGLATGRGRAPGMVREEDRAALAPWAAAWTKEAARAFVLAYEEAMADSGLLPDSQEARRDMLEVLILEKALQEAEAELTFRPAWGELPLDSAVAQLTGERRLNPW
jgi:maltose alpha-D-glucosyltransferase/alpha-amylase